MLLDSIVNYSKDVGSQLKPYLSNVKYTKKTFGK